MRLDKLSDLNLGCFYAAFPKENCLPTPPGRSDQVSVQVQEKVQEQGPDPGPSTPGTVQVQDQVQDKDIFVMKIMDWTEICPYGSKRTHTKQGKSHMALDNFKIHLGPKKAYVKP